MRPKIEKSTSARIEPALAEILTLLQGEQVTLLYTGKKSAASEIAGSPCAAFRTSFGEVALTIPGHSAKESYLSIVQKIAQIDESEEYVGEIEFLGFCATPPVCHRYAIPLRDNYRDNSPRYVFAALRNESFPKQIQEENEHFAEAQLLTVPFRLKLFTRRAFVSGKKNLTCSLGKILLPHRREDFGVYVYFHNGGLEMTVCQNGKTRTDCDLDLQQAGADIEFVLDSFELSLADALSLRPGDSIRIESAQVLQGVIRVGGGDWVRGTLSFTEEGAFIDLRSFSEKETFSLKER